VRKTGSGRPRETSGTKKEGWEKKKRTVRNGRPGEIGITSSIKRIWGGSANEPIKDSIAAELKKGKGGKKTSFFGVCKGRGGKKNRKKANRIKKKDGHQREPSILVHKRGRG